MTVLSPYADLRGRALFDLDAQRWERRQSPPIYIGKCRAQGLPGNEWTLLLESVPQSFRRREADLKAAAELPYHAGFVTDISTFYHALRPEVVGESLRHDGFTDPQVQGIECWLQWVATEGVSGIPVGFELSILMANHVLTLADRHLLVRQVFLSRWTDDFIVLADSVDQADDAFASVKTDVEALGLQLNPDKMMFLRSPEEVSHYLATRKGASREPLGLGRDHPLVTGIRDEHGDPIPHPWLEDHRREVAEDLFMTIFEDASDLDEVASQLRYHLKVFRGLAIASSLITGELLSHPERWRLAPSVVSGFLAGHLSQSEASHAIALARDCADQGFEEQAVHLLHACQAVQLGATEAQFLLKLARSTDCKLLAGTARVLASRFSEQASQDAVEGGELETLHAAEQRWVIGSVHLTPRRRRYLEGIRPLTSCPGTIDWKLAAAA